MLVTLQVQQSRGAVVPKSLGQKYLAKQEIQTPHFNDEDFKPRKRKLTIQGQGAKHGGSQNRKAARHGLESPIVPGPGLGQLAPGSLPSGVGAPSPQKSPALPRRFHASHVGREEVTRASAATRARRPRGPAVPTPEHGRGRGHASARTTGAHLPPRRGPGDEQGQRLRAPSAPRRPGAAAPRPAHPPPARSPSGSPPPSRASPEPSPERFISLAPLGRRKRPRARHVHGIWARPRSEGAAGRGDPSRLTESHGIRCMRHTRDQKFLRGLFLMNYSVPY